MIENVLGRYIYPIDCNMLKVKHISPTYMNDKLTLIYCLKGEMNFFAGQCRGKMKSDELLFINSKEMYHLEASTENDIIIAHIDVLNETFYKKGTLCTEKTPEIEEIKDLLLTFIFMKCNEHIYEVDDSMQFCKQIINKVNYAFQMKTDDENTRLLQKMFKEINCRYKEVITAERLAEEYGLDPRHIARLFRKAGAGSVTEYVKYVRCVQAAIMLSELVGLVEKISDECGFASKKMFYRHFREFSGDTPKQMQLKYKKLTNYKEKRNMTYGDHHTVQTALNLLGERAATRIIEKNGTDSK